MEKDKEKEERRKEKGLLSLIEEELSRLRLNNNRKRLLKYPPRYKKDFPDNLLGYFNQLNSLDNIQEVKLIENYDITPKVKGNKNTIHYSAKISYKINHPEEYKEFLYDEKLISPTKNNKICLNSKSISDLINNIEQMLPETYSSVKLGVEKSHNIKGMSTGEKEVNRDYKITINIVPSNNRGLIQKIIHFKESAIYDRGENVNNEEEKDLNTVKTLLQQKEKLLNENKLVHSQNYK